MKRDRFLVGLTGGIGSGKTEALKTFRRLGAGTISLDEVARRQAEPGGPAFRGIVKAFGRGVLGAGGSIDRKALAAKVFKDRPALRRLERLTHPLILKEMRRRLRELRGVVVVDVPLLFEGGHRKNFDVSMMISTPDRRKARRIVKRDGLTPAEARARMVAQMTDSERRRHADIDVPNEGSLKNFQRKIAEYYRAFHLIQASPVGVPRTPARKRRR